MNERDTKKYVLKDKDGKPMYYGITNDLERRETEHQQSGKKFASMEQVGRATTRTAASAWEEQAILDYKDSHRGHLPKYNKNETGK